MTPSLHGARTLLRPWREADRAPFAALNGDPRVMEYFPSPLSAADSDAMIERIEAHFARHGFGFWALEVPGHLPFAGFVGLAVPSFEAPFMPCVEIGWRLATAAWGAGYAREAARVCLDHAFDGLGLDEVVSFTTRTNARSMRVMEAIGMTRDVGGDFDHPRITVGHHLRPHVLYRAPRPTR